jgi:hypothetical protein
MPDERIVATSVMFGLKKPCQGCLCDGGCSRGRKCLVTCEETGQPRECPPCV